MLRTLDVVLIAAMIGAATVTYQIKHRSEDKLDEVHSLQAAIKLQKDTIDLLEADWSLLNQPPRLERLTREYSEQLGLETITPLQMARPEEIPGYASEFAPEVAEGETAPDTSLTTGSVKP